MSEAKVFHASKNVRNVTATQNKKTVYKSVVSSPFILKWPTIHTDLGKSILTQLIKTLEPAGEYKRACRLAKKKKQPIPQNDPDLNKRIHVGINSVTRYMETYIQTRQSKGTPVIYICKREIKPLQLCQHLLYMAAVAKIKLVPMPNDTESKLGLALGINKACVVLIEVMENKEESLRLSAREVPLIDAPWLNNALDQQASYRNDDTIKIIKTTGPLMKKNQQQQQKQKQAVLKRKNDDSNGTDSDSNKKAKQ